MRGVSLFLASPRKSKKEGDPGSVPLRGFPALLGLSGGCGTRASPSNSPRPFPAQTCVARHLSRGPEIRHCSALSVIKECCTSLLRPPSQRKGDPRGGALWVPCATRPAGRLAKLACGSDNASRRPPASLRCSAPLMGIPETSWDDGSAQEQKCLFSATDR